MYFLIFVSLSQILRTPQISSDLFCHQPTKVESDNHTLL